MKFAHIADVHLGAWRDPTMRQLPLEALKKVVQQIIQEQVDFLLVAGDLFDTSLPAIDLLKETTKLLKTLKTKQIPVYVIPGSHDYSPSGKSMIDVLEAAGLLTNACKGQMNQETNKLELTWTIDPKTQAKITGVLGRYGQLEKEFFEKLDYQKIKNEPGYKIFMFHTTIKELLTNDFAFMHSHPLSYLPPGCNYYAGGHIHHPTNKTFEGYPNITYTGALYPANFAELETYKQGGYYLVEVQNNEQQITFKPLIVKEHLALTINCESKTPQEVTQSILNKIEEESIENKTITLRLKGKIKQGRITQVDFKTIFQRCYEKQAFFVMKNTAKVIGEEFAQLQVRTHESKDIEEEVIKEHLGQLSQLGNQEEKLQLTKQLLKVCATSKKEGETTASFQERLLDELKATLKTTDIKIKKDSL